jgi:hypothetical protein
MTRWSCLVIAALSACAEKNDLSNGALDHVLDRAVAATFAKENIVPAEAPRPELCRRLFADLIGRYPSKEEIASECEGRSIDAIAKSLQERPEYLLVAERHWRDRMSVGETELDWRYYRELYARVDDLHRGRLRYDDFAREVSAHPAFFLETDRPVNVALSVFWGRPANDAEEAAIAPLYKPWDGQEVEDPDFPYVILYRAIYAPEECEYGTPCATDLFGGAELELEGEAFVVPFEEMTPAQRRATQAIGELLTSQPLFWEAEADDLLDRFLGWSDGGRTPRRPGTILPDVRLALANWLEETGDLPGAERLVLTSQLYTMPADLGAEDAPVYAHGPLKAAQAEVWLDSLLRLRRPTYELGTCDVRYLGNDSEYLLYDAFEVGLIDEDRLYQDLEKLHRLQGDRRPFGEEGPDETYQSFADSMGGCPLLGKQRYEASALAFGYAQEALSHLLCEGVEASLDRQMQVLFGRDPTDQERSDFSDASNGREICIGLSGSAEMLFY